jgi:hypothetical protein
MTWGPEAVRMRLASSAKVQVSVYGHVSCVAANPLTYRVERTSSGWRVAGVAAWGPVS